jgi:dipeptidase D
MNNQVSKLQPTSIWRNFVSLNSVPRPSKKEEKIVNFLIKFAENNNLRYSRDKIGNLVIFKDATSDMVDRKTIVLQSHVDMVHEKNQDVQFNFEELGIQMYVESGWVKAKGTTLGADNGLGVAAIMGILESSEISHPKIEALFTIDEETGMTGALNLSDSILNGKILLNLDTEEDDEICIGCAGGIDITVSNKFKLETPRDDDSFLKIIIDGLTGGHSGAEIHKGLGNANKILFSALAEISNLYSLNICEISGGGLRNAIPRECSVIISINNNNIAEVQKLLPQINLLNLKDLKSTDPNFSLSSKIVDFYDGQLNALDSSALINAINDCPNGVYKMSNSIDGLVETSNNLANIQLKNSELLLTCLTRSSIEISKMELSDKIYNIFTKIGYKCNLSGGYPGWEPNVNSETLKNAISSYTRLFTNKPKVNVIHAGLECGIIGSHYPDMEMISFGPTILGAHSPDERASIKSTQKFWIFFKEILKNIPKSN